MTISQAAIHQERLRHSKKRLAQLRREIAKITELDAFPNLAIFGVGSYARLEASQYSDIDLFFVNGNKTDACPDPQTNKMRIFGQMIEIIDRLSFPKLSNDCEFLVMLHKDDILAHLGSRSDDQHNYFTARMLLLLESTCLHGPRAYSDITKQIVASYFKDFPDHRHSFQPIFLLNDICRFWKTMLLNYEHKRRPTPDGQMDEERKTKQKVRNFKLKYSRMTTCFATIAALGSYSAPVTENQVVDLIALTPRQRLEEVRKRLPATKAAVDNVIQEYNWFLGQTGLKTEELESRFSDKQKRTEMFTRANKYGGVMYDLLTAIDRTDSKLGLLRYLVI